MDDERIREVAGRGMRRRPTLIRVHRLRNAVVTLGMLIAVAVLARFSSLDLGVIFMTVGGIATALLLGWNLIWVNTVLHRVTLDEVTRDLAEALPVAPPVSGSGEVPRQSP